MKQRSVQPPVPPDTPPSSSPFPYADYVQAHREILDALHTGHFYGLLTAASGMGKTCLLRQILTDLDRHRFNVLYVSSSRASVVGIVRFVAQRLHVSPRRSYLETAHVLAEAIQGQTASLLLWIDEADQVDPATLQDVRMLAEAQPADGQLLSVVLSGLPPLIALLDVPALFPLKRRIAHRFSLAGLRRDELDAFIEHRFGSAAAHRIRDAARDELFERTLATPALLDSVVRHTLKKSDAIVAVEDIRAALDAAGL